MSYTFEQLKEDVRKEAEALKVHATKEERGRLSIELLKPTDKTSCIYGLISGHCHNSRAAELLDKCTIRHFDCLPDRIEELEDTVSDKPKNFIEVRMEYLDEYTFSAIEVYIQLDKANNANLIAFLRGETESLEL